MYADYAYYKANGGMVSEREITPKLATASDNIDVLTFYRIHGIGWEKLTKFQQAQIKKACCTQADFLYDNEDAVNSALEHYSINGVTMKFGNAALYEIVQGVPFSNAAMGLLRSTGLATRMALYREVEPCYFRDW